MHNIDRFQENLRSLLKRLSSAFLLCPVAMWLLLPAVLHAQYRTSIQGVVTDPSGAVIPGANLTLTNNGTGEKQVRVSDASGVYNFNALPADQFSLVVTKDGFQEKDLLQLQLDPRAAKRNQRAAHGWTADSDGDRGCLDRACH